MTGEEAIEAILDHGTVMAELRGRRRLVNGGEKAFELEAAALRRAEVEVDVETRLAVLRKLARVGSVDPKNNAAIETAVIEAICQCCPEVEERVVAFCLEEPGKLAGNLVRFGAPLADSPLLPARFIELLESRPGAWPSWLLRSLRFDQAQLRRLVELRRQGPRQLRRGTRRDPRLLVGAAPVERDIRRGIGRAGRSLP
jgi:hypothetical protein